MKALFVTYVILVRMKILYDYSPYTMFFSCSPALYWIVYISIIEKLEYETKNHQCGKKDMFLFNISKYYDYWNGVIRRYYID